MSAREKKASASKANHDPAADSLPTQTVVILFAELETHVPSASGLYEIHTKTGIALKVGTAVNLLKRLKSHRASRDSGLRWKAGADKKRPSDVESKSSILAKHLYFDSTIAAGLDLKTQADRRRFLAEHCHVLVRPMSLEEAIKVERVAEAAKTFRYVGMVQVR